MREHAIHFLLMLYFTCWFSCPVTSGCLCSSSPRAPVFLAALLTTFFPSHWCIYGTITSR